MRLGVLRGVDAHGTVVVGARVGLPVLAGIGGASLSVSSALLIASSIARIALPKYLSPNSSNPAFVRSSNALSEADPRRDIGREPRPLDIAGPPKNNRTCSIGAAKFNTNVTGEFRVHLRVHQ